MGARSVWQSEFAIDMIPNIQVRVHVRVVYLYYPSTHRRTYTASGSVNLPSATTQRGVGFKAVGDPLMEQASRHAPTAQQSAPK